MSIYIGNKKVSGLIRGEDISHATEVHAGIIEIATQNEVSEGTDDSKAITPLKAKNIYGGKVQIDYEGSSIFKIGDRQLNFKDIYDLLLVSKDFTFIVYGNRAYLCSFINDESSTKELRFESVIISDNKTKTSSIYITSNNGVNITSVSSSDINSENQSNKADTIIGNETSNEKYPSVKATKDYVDSVLGDLDDALEIIANRAEVVSV